MQAYKPVLILSMFLPGLSLVAAGQTAYPMPPGAAAQTPAAATTTPAQSSVPASAPQETTPAVLGSSGQSVVEATAGKAARPKKETAAQKEAAAKKEALAKKQVLARKEALAKKQAAAQEGVAAQKEAVVPQVAMPAEQAESASEVVATAATAPATATESSKATKAKKVAAVKEPKPVKPKKLPYSGPTEIVTLPATPMLDEGGRAELDPDGKPLYNAPQKQMRDKKGHPMFDDKGQPVYQTVSDPGYDEKGKKIKVVKEKPPKLVPVHIARGTLSVDGVVGKAALNYDISDLKYMYMYVPGIGTAVISNHPFPGAKEEKTAFNDRILMVTVGDHKLELASDNNMLGKKPESAYVKVDRDYSLPSRYPVFGYGTLRVAPYMWPGAKPNAVLAGTLAPPPLPKNLLPSQLATAPCPKGQVRGPSAKVLEGQPAVVAPCMSTEAAAAAAAKLKGTTPDGPGENLGR